MIKFRVSFCTLILFLVTLCSWSQNNFTLSGTISNEKTGESMFGANISIEGTSIGVITNEYGFYSLNAPQGNYTIIISYLGFNTIKKELNLTENIRLNIELKENTEALDEVFIGAKGNSKKINIQSPSMSTIKLNAMDIKNTPVVLGEVDPIKALQLLPGFTKSGEFSAGFNVRGGAADQNLVQLDEATVYNTDHLFGLISVFNTDAIKSVQLYKGGIPAKFGGRISSVLDIHQKDGNSKKFQASGGIGLLSSRLTLEGPINKNTSFLLAGRGSYVNLFLKLNGTDAGVGFYDLNAKISHKFNDNNKLFLSGYFGKDRFRFGKTFTNSYGNASFNLRWNHIFSDKLFSNASAIFSDYDFQLDIPSLGLEWRSGITNYNFKYDFKYYASDDIKLNFGANTHYYKFLPGNVTLENDGALLENTQLDEKFAIEPALYVEAEHKLSEKFTARYGFRYSSFTRLGSQTFNTYENDLPVVYNSELNIYERALPTGEVSFGKGKKVSSFGTFEPRVSLSYQLNEKSAVKASYQRMSQYIHLISNTNSPTPIDAWAPSGPFIEPQRSHQFGIGYFKNFKNDTYSFETEVFYKKVSNRIDYIDGADLIANNTIETEILSGESRAYGLELLFRKNKGKFTGLVAYTLSRSEQRTPGNTINEPGLNNGNWYNSFNDRTHDLSLTASYKWNEKWAFNANFVYQTGRPTNFPNGQYEYENTVIVNYVDRNASRLPAFHRMDISATYTPKGNARKKWKSEWVFGIYNVYARQNATSITFRQQETNFRSSGNRAYKLSIFSVIPSITYNFKF